MKALITCGDLENAINDVKVEVAQLKRFAKDKGLTPGDTLKAFFVQTTNPTDEENLDPELFRQVQDALRVSSELSSRTTDLCEDGEDDGDGNDGDRENQFEDSKARRLVGRAARTAGQAVREAGRGVPMAGLAVKANMIQLARLTNWTSDMDKAVHGIETKVHPTGKKWWRYRYQYSFVESIFLIPCIAFLFLIHQLLTRIGFYVRMLNKHGHVAWLTVHSHWSNKEPTPAFYKPVLTAFLFHVVGIAVTFFVIFRFIYHMGFFDWFALQVRWLVGADDVSKGSMAIPYVGENYYEHFTAVMSHLMWSIIIFCVLVTEIVRGFVLVVDRFRALEMMHEAKLKQDPQERSRAIKEAEEKLKKEGLWKYVDPQLHPYQPRTQDGDFTLAGELFSRYEQSFVKGLHNKTQQEGQSHGGRRLTKAMNDLNLIPAIPVAVSAPQAKEAADVSRQRLRKYIRLVFMRGASKLAIPTWTLCITMILLAVFSGLLAYFFKIAFVFLLPPLILLTGILFVVLFFISRMLLNSALNNEEKARMPWLTETNFCHTMQIILYIDSYLLARLIFSVHMWMDYTYVSISALICLIIVIILFWQVGAIVMKRSILALALPPNVSTETLAHLLERVSDRASHHAGGQFAASTRPSPLHSPRLSPRGSSLQVPASSGRSSGP